MHVLERQGEYTLRVSYTSLFTHCQLYGHCGMRPLCVKNPFPDIRVLSLHIILQQAGHGNVGALGS